MSTAAIVWIVVSLLGLTGSVCRDGKPKTGDNKFAVDFFAMFLGFLLLLWGGFFSIK